RRGTSWACQHPPVGASMSHAGQVPQQRSRFFALQIRRGLQRSNQFLYCSNPVCRVLQISQGRARARLAMPPFLSSLASRVTPFEAATANAFARFAPAAAFHLAAFVVMIWSEFGPFRMAVFVFAWGLTNFGWLVLLRRPGLSAALSFAMLVSLVAVS